MNVYLVRAGNRGAIKIGVAVNVERRMAALQTGNAFELKLLATIKCRSKEEAYILEKQLHAKFERQKIRGEWFQGNIKFRGINEILIDSDQTMSSTTKEKSDYVHIKNAKKKRKKISI